MSAVYPLTELSAWKRSYKTLQIVTKSIFIETWRHSLFLSCNEYDQVVSIKSKNYYQTYFLIFLNHVVVTSVTTSSLMKLNLINNLCCCRLLDFQILKTCFGFKISITFFFIPHHINTLQSYNPYVFIKIKIIFQFCLKKWSYWISISWITFAIF